MALTRGQRAMIFDANLQLQDSTAGALTASAAGVVASVAKILDLGGSGLSGINTSDLATTGRVDAVAVHDVSAITVGNVDNIMGLELQFSNSATFASGVVTGPTFKLGGTTGVPGNSAASVTGRYETPFTNEINGTRYRYMRLYVRIAGTSPSITLTSNVFKTIGE